MPIQNEKIKETTDLPNGIVERQCAKCGSDSFKQLPNYSKDHWRVGECCDCGFVYLQNAPVYDRLVDEFAWEKTGVIETERRYKDRPVSARLSMVFRRLRKPFRIDEKKMFSRMFKPGPVLDIGCGHGSRIPDRFTPYGIELSRALCESSNEQMQPRGGYAVHAPATDGIETFDTGFFNGIIMRSFLEHERQPKKLLESAFRVLADDGVIFIRVPNYASFNRRIRGSEWCGFRYPDHVNYFTPNSLAELVRECGFDMKLLNPMKISIDDNIKAVLTKSTPANGEKP